MKTSKGLLLGIGTALMLLGGIASHKLAFGQSKQAPEWMLDEAKLPPDVHPDTLSRMPRPKESDYATDEEKKIFNTVMHRNPTQFIMRWLGPTGTRVAIPELAAGGEGTGNQGVEPKYRELAVAAVNRELDNRDEFLNHEEDGIKEYGEEIQNIIKLHKDTKGLDPKAAAIIEFARDLFKFPRTAPLSAKALADLEQNFGRKGALSIVATALSYDTNFIEMRAYDQHMDVNADCLPGGHHGCLDLKNPPTAWEVATASKPAEEKESDWLAGQAKLPADVLPETLSRLPRPKASDFTSDKEKETFNKVMSHNPDLATMRWLGPMGLRLIIPGYAEGVEQLNQVIYTKSGVDSKYLQLAIAVTTRENGNRQEFLNRNEDGIKAYGKEVQEIVRLRKATTGLDPKQAAIIEFGRDLFKFPRNASVSPKAFADLNQNFGKRGALGIIALMAHHDTNWMLMRVYNQRMDTSADCMPGGHHGCLNLKAPPPTW